MWETNKKFIFVSYLVRVHDLVRGEESQEQEEEKEEEGRRRKKEKEKKSKIKVCLCLRIKCMGFLGLGYGD